MACKTSRVRWPTSAASVRQRLSRSLELEYATADPLAAAVAPTTIEPATRPTVQEKKNQERWAHGSASRPRKHLMSMRPASGSGDVKNQRLADRHTDGPATTMACIHARRIQLPSVFPCHVVLSCFSVVFDAEQRLKATVDKHSNNNYVPPLAKPLPPALLSLSPGSSPRQSLK